MMNLQSIQKVASGAKSMVASMEKIIGSLNKKIEEADADKTRSQGFKAEQIKAARDEAMPGLLADLKAIRDAAGAVEPHREFWADRALLLSRVPFDPDPAIDATLRIRYAGELVVMDAVLLSATQKNAISDRDLALTWACVMAGRVAAHGDLADLSGLEIPQQSEALGLIDSLDASLAAAEMIVATASGMSMSPAQKLTLAHRMQPNEPTRHNSEGRVTPSQAVPQRA